jgi:hypothetical protein
MTTNPPAPTDGPSGPAQGLARWRATGRELSDRGRVWLDGPDNRRRLVRLVLPVLVLAGLFLPPVSLWTRITTWDYTALRPGQDTFAPAPGTSATFTVAGRSVTRPARARLRRDDGAARRLPPLPAGRAPLSDYYRLDLVGTPPRDGAIELGVATAEGDHPFVDAYGWDGQRWRWLSPQFFGPDRLRVLLPLHTFVPRFVVVALASQAATQVSASLLPPPATVPAAMAELPILELRAFHLAGGDGSVAGQPFALPSRQARVYGVVDNLENGQRLRSDLINNLLIDPRARQRHRAVLTDLIRRERLDGVILDYRGIDTDLQSTYTGFLGRLAGDVRRAGAELVVVVPMPRRTSAGWDASPYNWRDLGSAVDGLRVALPDDRPLEIDELDSLVRWALPSVERSRLQLALPVQGRDVTADGVAPIGYGEALARILGLASADAPERISPGTTTTVDLPGMRQAGLKRDGATGMWRFNYWDANRREHTVWLNDAAGLQPAFAIAARYRLGRIALDGVAAGLDPALWRMVKDFIAGAKPTAALTAYRLQWQLVDGQGRVVQQSVQPLEATTFSFRAPPGEGSYRLRVNLVTEEDRLAAIGGARELRVAPPPPATPRPTDVVIFIEPTPEAIVTAPPPRDETALARRTPVRVGTAVATKIADYNAVVAFADGPMRGEPDFGAPVVTDLRVGDRLQVLGATPDGSWLRAVHPATGIEGWVRKELLNLLVPLAEIGRQATPDLTEAATSPPAPAPTRPPGSRSR